jgi:PIN domain nuclease of toxin-antitoxin system
LSGILLDTCAALWVAENQPLAPQAVAALDTAFDERRPVFISEITAWEVGMLVSRGRLALSQSPAAWFRRLANVQGVQIAPLNADHFVDSSFLPGAPPRDPADRVFAATARREGMVLMTRDGLLLDYSRQGHLQAMAC